MVGSEVGRDGRKEDRRRRGNGARKGEQIACIIDTTTQTSRLFRVKIAKNKVGRK